MGDYRLWQDGYSSDVEADTDEEACEEARAWALEGDYGPRSTSMWVDVHVARLDRAAPDDIDQRRDVVDVDTVTVAIDPDEPDCAHEDGHDWSDEGVRGHGGGVILSHRCLRCGLGRVVDTWAQRPDTGTQGLESVTYTPGAYEDDDADLTQ